MRKRVLFGAGLCLALVMPAFAHDLFLKLDSYFLAPNSKFTLKVLNGTFLASEALLSRDRIRDASLLTPEGRRQPPIEAWRDRGTTTLLEAQTSAPGTYAAGISTLPRDSKKTAAVYNEYLEHEGLPERLAERRARGEMDKDVRERYSKHIRAVFQVGDRRTDDFKQSLGYPVEIIPRQNPYELTAGQTLEVLCLKDGNPIANQFVTAAVERGGKLSAPVGLRTDRRGIAKFKLSGAGRWYVKFLSTQPAVDADVDYETFWATLTFEIRSKR